MGKGCKKKGQEGAGDTAKTTNLQLLLQRPKPGLQRLVVLRHRKLLLLNSVLRLLHLILFAGKAVHLFVLSFVDKLLE